MNEKMLEMTMISLDDGVVMPELSFYLDATTREACEAVGHAVKNEECIFLANPVHKNGDKTVSFYEIGVIARIKQFVRLQNKGMRVLIQTEKRARLVDYSKDKYYVCHVTDVEETNDISEDEEKAIQSILKEKLKEAFDEGIVKNNVLYREIRSFKSVRKLVDSMADYVNISDDNRQELLEMLDVRSRAMRLIQIMEEVLGIGKIKKEIMEKVNEVLYESKLIGYPQPFKNKVRTFCQNPGGFVSQETYDNDLAVVNGHSYKELKSDNTNLAILVSHNFNHPFNQPIAYAQKVGELTNMLAAGHILVQRFGDILDGKRTWPKELAQSNVRPTLPDAVAGDITAAMPYRAMINIINFIQAMDEVVPGFASSETLLYSPELKFYSNRIKMDEHFNTNVRGLHCLGDSSGWTRGLMMASVMGVLMGREIAERELGKIPE